jgi:hypothetical protein
VLLLLLLLLFTRLLLFLSCHAACQHCCHQTVTTPHAEQHHSDGVAVMHSGWVSCKPESLSSCLELPVTLCAPAAAPAVSCHQLASIAATLVFYAPPHGLGPILTDMVAVLGSSRRAVVARELTKLHEEFYRWML